MLKWTLLPQGLEFLANQFSAKVPAVVNPILASKYGTHFMLNSANGLSIDYSQIGGGPKVSYDEDTWTLALNGTFFSNKTTSTSFTPATFDPSDR